MSNNYEQISDDKFHDLINTVFAEVNPSGYAIEANFEDHGDISVGSPTLEMYAEIGSPSVMMEFAQELGSLYEGYQHCIHYIYGYSEADNPDDRKFQKIDELIKAMYLALVKANHPLAALRLYPKQQMPISP